jgi:hypothetical protein
MAIGVAERYADQLATEDERWDALRLVLESVGGETHRNSFNRSWTAIERLSVPWAVSFTLKTERDDLFGSYSGRCIHTQVGVESAAGVIVGYVKNSMLDAARIAMKGAPRTTEPMLNPLVRLWRGIKHGVRCALDLDNYYDKLVGERLVHEWSQQTELLRDIFGNPFRPVGIDPDWRTSTVVALARHMYESRDFSAMPILADALQDAGCENEHVLNHCRDPQQVHVRGCWVVDLVLGKD